MHIIYSLVIAVVFVLWRTGVVDDLWAVINVLSCLVIALAFYFSLERKRKHDASGETGITREYLESNVMYFATIILAALFLFNWLNVLVNGPSEVGEEVMHDVVWGGGGHHDHRGFGRYRRVFVAGEFVELSKTPISIGSMGP